MKDRQYDNNLEYQCPAAESGEYKIKINNYKIK